MTFIGLFYHTLSLAERLERICFHVASFIFIIPCPATCEASLALALPLPSVQYHLEVTMKMEMIKKDILFEFTCWRCLHSPGRRTVHRSLSQCCMSTSEPFWSTHQDSSFSPRPYTCTVCQGRWGSCSNVCLYTKNIVWMKSLCN